jgi:hypothetical protein
MNESTRRKASGRFQAAVKAQLAPEDAPPIARRFGSSVSEYSRATSGRISSSRKRT